MCIESTKRKSFRDSLPKKAVQCSYAILIKRYNKSIYKNSITPCDILYRLLFSKIPNSPFDTDCCESNLNKEAKVIPDALPVSHITDCDQIVAGTRSPLKLTTTRLISKALTQKDTFDPPSALICIQFAD